MGAKIDVRHKRGFTVATEATNDQSQGMICRRPREEASRAQNAAKMHKDDPTARVSFLQERHARIDTRVLSQLKHEILGTRVYKRHVGEVGCRRLLPGTALSGATCSRPYVKRFVSIV